MIRYIFKLNLLFTLQEHETNDREEVDEDDGKDEGENDGPHVPCNGPDHILESLLMSDEVNELEKIKERDREFLFGTYI